MSNFLKNRKNGFSILSVILTIVVIIIAISIWAISGQTNANNQNNYETDILVSSLVNDSNIIQAEYDRLRLEGHLADEILYTKDLELAANNPNILDPMKGIKEPEVNPKIMIPNFPRDPMMEMWRYAPFFGSRAEPTDSRSMIMLSGITDSVCKRTNQNYNNYSEGFGVKEDNNIDLPSGISHIKIGCISIETGDESIPKMNIFVRYLS